MNIERHPVIDRRIRWRYVCTGDFVGDQWNAVTTFIADKKGEKVEIRQPAGAAVDIVLHGEQGVRKYIESILSCKNILEFNLKR